ncbi:hypothetical protein [Bordetella pertussis]|nr:hypothetical protein [Bordetella pertussis]
MHRCAQVPHIAKFPLRHALGRAVPISRLNLDEYNLLTVHI